MTSLWEPSLESGLALWLTLINRIRQKWCWASSGSKPQEVLVASTFLLMGASFWALCFSHLHQGTSYVNEPTGIFQPSHSPRWFQPSLTSCESEESPTWTQSTYSILSNSRIVILSFWVLVWFIEQQLISNKQTKLCYILNLETLKKLPSFNAKLIFQLRTLYPIALSSDICFFPHTILTTVPIDGVGIPLALCCPPVETSAPLKLMPSGYVPL